MTRISKNLYESPEMEEIKLTIEYSFLAATQCSGGIFSLGGSCSTEKPRSMRHYDSSDMENYE